MSIRQSCGLQNCTKCGLARYQNERNGSHEARLCILQSSNHVRDAWLHIWGDSLAIGVHRIQLGCIVDREFRELAKRKTEREEMALTLLEEAVAERCRSTMELVGHA